MTLAASLCAQSNVIDEVIWIVGDDAILKSDVENEILRAEYEGIDIENPYCIIPEQIAIQRLFVHQAKLDSITANEGTVAMQVEHRINYFISQIGSREKLEEYFGKTLTQIREESMEQVREQMLVQQVQQKIVGEQKVSPAEVRKFYNSLPEDEIPIVPTKVEVQIITFEPKATQKEIDDIKDKLRGFKERIEKGDAEFSMLARLYSEDMESAKNGGELGFMGRAQLVPEFSEVAFGLIDNQKVSRIVETEFGYHIIQLIERRGDRVNARHILLKPRVSFVEKNAALNRIDSLANVLREGKITFEQAALLHSQDKNTRANGGVMVNPNDGTSKFELQDLPSEVARAVNNLNVNEISKPFTMRNSSDKEVWAIVKLRYRMKEHRANPTDDYQELKEHLLEKKNEEAIHAWIAKKQTETYIRIDERYRNCEFRYPNWVKK